ncbi:RNA polymerase sigma factor [Candidatus Palauibacter sp.]|uniref:RNA polymerase sigma factor n=1 Tax=Candidatus Palauibacter sp. TaxID=3101350 RepID=UPI003D0A496B
MLTSEQERRLADEAGRGDREALECLYREYSDELYDIARRLTGSSADAYDVVHSMFGRLPAALRGYARHRPLRPWLHAVTVRAALSQIRRERRRGEVSMPDDRVDEASVGTPLLDFIMLERALSSLPEGYRSVIVLKEFQGYSHREIGKLLGISRAASRARLCRARIELRAMLADE